LAKPLGDKDGYILEECDWGITSNVTQSFVGGAFSGSALPTALFGVLWCRPLLVTPMMYEHRDALEVHVGYWYDVSENADYVWYTAQESRDPGEAFSIDNVVEYDGSTIAGGNSRFNWWSWPVDGTYITSVGQWLALAVGRRGDLVDDDYTGNLIVSSTYLVRSTS